MGYVRILRLVFSASLLVAVFSPDPAGAHGGGLDGNGGHHCRQAGYDSGKCAPLDSYHCHQAGCTSHDGDAPLATTTTTTPLPPPTTPPSTQAPSTTVPTTMAAAPTTTELSTTTSTAASVPFSDSTTTTLAVVHTEPVSDTGAAGNPIPGLVVVGAMGYGTYRVVKRLRPGRPSRS